MQNSVAKEPISNDVGATSAPQRALEYLYYPCPSGYVFAATSLAVRQQMPFYGMVLIATTKTPIRLQLGTQTIEGMAIALWAKDVHFVTPNTQFVSVAVNPLHPLFRAFTLLSAPYAIPLEHERYVAFTELMLRARDGLLTHVEALALFNGVLSASREFLPPTPALDSRAKLLVKMMWENPRCSLAEMAQHLNLSYHRTSHLFTDTIGLSVRTYQLWQKLYRAGASLLAGASLTDTAHAAGFVDSAHYSRSFQIAFGRCPTEMFKIRSITVFFSNAFRNTSALDHTQ